MDNTVGGEKYRIDWKWGMGEQGKGRWWLVSNPEKASFYLHIAFESVWFMNEQSDGKECPLKGNVWSIAVYH